MHYFSAFFIRKHLFSASLVRNPGLGAIVLWATFKENIQGPLVLNRPGHALIPINFIRMKETND